MSSQRILTGYRPTGKLHLGHWFGNLQNMLDLQNNYDAFYFLADWHALTSDWADTSKIRTYTEEMVLDWCAAGLNPDLCTIYRQSDIPEVAELTLYFAMVTPMSWLERVPTYKEQRDQITDKDLGNVGFFEYPMLMAADIAIMRSGLIPVGEDQLPHLELTREIVRRFNNAYPAESPVLVEPKAVIATEGARVPGLDGRKMSKSYGNSIFISDDSETICKKAMTCLTDPARMLKTDPGNPDICPLHQIHKLIMSKEDCSQWEEDCRSARCGCVAHKKAFGSEMADYFAPFREKRAELEKQPGFAAEVLANGARKARPIAVDTITACREAMLLDPFGA